jgi:hypothetical protein
VRAQGRSEGAATAIIGRCTETIRIDQAMRATRDGELFLFVNDSKLPVLALEDAQRLAARTWQQPSDRGFAVQMLWKKSASDRHSRRTALGGLPSCGWGMRRPQGQIEWQA